MRSARQSSAFPRSRSPTAMGSTASCRSATPASVRACSRSSARCWASPGPAIWPQARRSTGWCCSPRTSRATPISASWFRRRISTGPLEQEPHVAFGKLEGLSEGLIALTAGGEGRAGAAARRWAARKAEAYLDRLQALFPRPALYRDHPPRRCGRGSGGRSADRPRLRARPAARRDQSRRLSRSRASTPRTMPCCASPIRPMSKAPTASTSSPDAWLKDGAAMGELFADLPEALANTVGDRPALRGRGAASASRSCRGSATTRTSSCAAMPMPGLQTRLKGRTAEEHAGLSRAARVRARRHHRHGLRRLLPDRRRLHQMGEGQRHSGRAGPRLGRGLGRRLGADHHRSRSDRARPAVRALPQSRARVDARLRHRLLRNPSRQGHHLRPAANMAATRSRRSSPSGG